MAHVTSCPAFLYVTAICTCDAELDPFTDKTKTGIFRDHSCYRCKDGEKPCVVGNPHHCEYPHARND